MTYINIMTDDAKIPIIKKTVKTVKPKKVTKTTDDSSIGDNINDASQLVNNITPQLDSNTLCKIDDLNDEIKLLKDQLLSIDQDIDALFNYEYEKKMKQNYLKKNELTAQIKHKDKLLDFIKQKGLGNVEGAYKLLSTIKS